MKKHLEGDELYCPVKRVITKPRVMDPINPGPTPLRPKSSVVDPTDT